MYKVEKSSGGKIKLFILAEVENENGEKVMARKLIKEQKKKDMYKGLDGEREMYNKDIGTANDGIKQLDEIKMLLDELDGESKA